jgi:hypothetical protein
MSGLSDDQNDYFLADVSGLKPYQHSEECWYHLAKIQRTGDFSSRQPNALPSISPGISEIIAADVFFFPPAHQASLLSLT